MTHRSSKPAALVLVLVLTLSFSLTPSPAAAVACNTGGCWAGLVNWIHVDTAGRIWFTVDNSAALNNLVPPDGCVVRSVWTGQAEPALYIPPADPRADTLYTTLLTAFTTGASVGFAPIKDPATGWCALGSLSLR